MGRIVLEQVSKEFPGGVQAVRSIAGDRERRVHGPGRPVGLRQDHDPAHDRRPRRGHQRRDHHRRPGGDRREAKDRDIAMVFQNYALYPT